MNCNQMVDFLHREIEMECRLTISCGICGTKGHLDMADLVDIAAEFTNAPEFRELGWKIDFESEKICCPECGGTSCWAREGW